MGTFILGWLVGWIFLVVVLCTMSYFHLRREKLEQGVRAEREAKEAAATQEMSNKLAKRAAELLEQIKADPVAAAVYDGLQRSVEHLVKREGVTFHYPPGLPPEPFIAVVKSVAQALELHLEQSRELHNMLDGGKKPEA